MKALVNAESGKELYDIPDEQPPLYYPLDLVLNTWLEHKMHHVLPESGGYMNQCPYLMRDWRTATMYHIRIEKGVFSAPLIPPAAPSWQNLMGD